MAPIGRPPSDPAKRREYRKAKDTPTPYQKELDRQKEARIASRAKKRVEREEAKAKERKARMLKRAKQGRYTRRKLEDDLEKESALEAYRGWSLAELRADCKDYGIADERGDWKRMSRDQLAVWLYRHKKSEARNYYF